VAPKWNRTSDSWWRGRGFEAHPLCCWVYGPGQAVSSQLWTKKQCETRGLFMSLVIRCWIGDVQDSQGVSASEMTCVGWSTVKRYSLTHLGKPLTHTCLCHEAVEFGTIVEIRWCFEARKVTMGLSALFSERVLEYFRDTEYSNRFGFWRESQL